MKKNRIIKIVKIKQSNFFIRLILKKIIAGIVKKLITSKLYKCSPVKLKTCNISIIQLVL